MIFQVPEQRKSGFFSRFFPGSRPDGHLSADSGVSGRASEKIRDVSAEAFFRRITCKNGKKRYISRTAGAVFPMRNRNRWKWKTGFSAFFAAALLLQIFCCLFFLLHGLEHGAEPAGFSVRTCAGSVCHHHEETNSFYHGGKEEKRLSDGKILPEDADFPLLPFWFLPRPEEMISRSTLFSQENWFSDRSVLFLWNRTLLC